MCVNTYTYICVYIYVTCERVTDRRTAPSPSRASPPDEARLIAAIWGGELRG